MLIVVTTGIPWRALPHDFTVTWSATHKHFTRWTRKQLWEQMLAVLRAEDRVHDGRDRRPTAAVIDSSSVKSTPVPGERGFDDAKKVDGIKRHILVDTGRRLTAHMTAANIQDRATFADLLTKNPCPSVTHVWADKGYTRQAPADAAAAAGIELEIVSGPKPVSGVPRPTTQAGRRTNQRVDQPAPTPRAAIRNYAHRPRSIRHPAPDPATTTPPRPPRIVVRQALGRVSHICERARGMIAP